MPIYPHVVVDNFGIKASARIESGRRLFIQIRPPERYPANAKVASPNKEA